MVIKMVSGGQAGVARAALDVALENDIACGGWCVKGRKAEDGLIEAKYPVVECASPSAATAAEANIRDSDGTLILIWGDLVGETLKVAAIGMRLKKPVRIVKMHETPKIEDIEQWATHYKIRVLNVAGPVTVASGPVYEEAKRFLKALMVGDEDVPAAEGSPS